MIVYILSFAISLVLLNLYCISENTIKKKIYLVLSMIPLIFISGFRYGVGTDYFFRYASDYEKILNGIDVDNLEYGFKLLIKFCQIFTEKYYLLFIITAFITIALIFLGIKDSSKNFKISLVLFFIGGYFFQSLNMVRQFMSMAILFYSFKYILKPGYKNIILYYIFALVAFFIHSSSAVMFILPLLKKIKLSLKPWVVLIIIISIILLKKPIYGLAELLLSYTRFNVYLVGHYAKSDITFLFITSNFIIYLFMFFSCMSKNNNDIKKFNTTDNVFISIQLLTVVLFTMSAMHVLFPRIAYYFQIFQIISIPYFVETMNFDYIKLKINKKNNNCINRIISKPICYLLVILFFSVILFYTNVINNDHEPLPYKNILFESGVLYE